MPHLAALRAPAVACVAIALSVGSPGAPAPAGPPPVIVGRWDVTIVDAAGTARPSWFEVRAETPGLTVRMVGPIGGPFAMPVVAWDGGRLELRESNGARWRGDFDGRRLTGSIDTVAWPAGSGTSRPDPPAARDRTAPSLRWTAERAPELGRRAVRWGSSIRLFDGRSLAGWRPRHAGPGTGWVVRDGVLANLRPADDLVTARAWSDFKLRLLFRLEPGSDSGVHLRGRYEVQLTDRDDPAPIAGTTGSIYGMVPPEFTARAVPGEWNTLEVVLVGREVSVTLNTIRVITRQPIPGITGDALDAHEGLPGPIMLQGRLGAVEFRDIEITPAL